jgi:hypothetical protein
LDLTKLNALELERLIPKESRFAVRASLATSRLLRRPLLGPDAYPDTLQLAVAEESDWDDLGASVQDAVAVKAQRDLLLKMGFTQVNAYRVVGLPYPRNFFAYVKDADTFAALYLSDAQGIKPYVEMYTQFRQPKDGKLGIVTSSADLLELDPSQDWIWLHLPGKDAEVIFQWHRSKVLEHGKANKGARTDEDFRSVYLEVANANYKSWIERGVLSPSSDPPAKSGSSRDNAGKDKA